MSIKRKAISDMVLNIIAAAIPVAVLQLVVYPISAKQLGGEEYGLMLTIYSIWIMISNTMGNVLNNIRLLYNSEYEHKGVQGDFLIMLRRWSVVNALVTGITILIYSGFQGVVHILLGIMIACLVLIKAYTEVGFRITINYKAITINNALQSIGFIIGCIISVYTDYWEFIFLVGYLISCVYCVVKTGLLRESVQKTLLYNKVTTDAYKLVVATAITSLINYADKLILYPLLGGYAVSIYYTATILGKIVSMLTNPINNVILTYIAKWKSNNERIMLGVLTTATIVVIIGYIVTLLFARTVMGFLYPQWVNEAMTYIPITTANVALMTIISTVNPFILKFCEMKWQIIIKGISAIVYFVSALLLWRLFDLMGFCIGTVIGSAVQVSIMLGVYFYNSKKSRQ